MSDTRVHSGIAYEHILLLAGFVLFLFSFQLQPVMNGLEALRTFYYWRKSDSENSINNNILVVGMSANAPGTEQDEAFSFGTLSLGHTWLSS